MTKYSWVRVGLVIYLYLKNMLYVTISDLVYTTQMLWHL